MSNKKTGLYFESNETSTTLKLDGKSLVGMLLIDEEDTILPTTVRTTSRRFRIEVIYNLLGYNVSYDNIMMNGIVDDISELKELTVEFLRSYLSNAIRYAKEEKEKEKKWLGWLWGAHYVCVGDDKKEPLIIINYSKNNILSFDHTFTIEPLKNTPIPPSFHLSCGVRDILNAEHLKVHAELTLNNFYDTCIANANYFLRELDKFV